MREENGEREYHYCFFVSFCSFFWKGNYGSMVQRVYILFSFINVTDKLIVGLVWLTRKCGKTTAKALVFE